MKYLLCILATLLIGGCAPFSSKDLARLRSRGVPPAAVDRLQNSTPLEPKDIVLLHKNRVPANALTKHLEWNGVDYLATPDDFRMLRREQVPAVVADRLAIQSEYFALQRQRPVVVGVSVGAFDPWYPWDYGPIPWWACR